MDVHIEHCVARAKQVTDHMVLGRVPSRLLNQVLIEIDRCNFPFLDEATNKRQFKVELLATPCFIRQVSKHLLAALSAIVLVLLAENSHLDVVDLDERDDTACTVESEWTDLCSSVVRDTCLEYDATDKVLTHHENRFSDLMITILRICRSLQETRAQELRFDSNTSLRSGE